MAHLPRKAGKLLRPYVFRKMLGQRTSPDGGRYAGGGAVPLLPEAATNKPATQSITTDTAETLRLAGVTCAAFMTAHHAQLRSQAQQIVTDDVKTPRCLREWRCHPLLRQPCPVWS